MTTATKDFVWAETAFTGIIPDGMRLITDHMPLKIISTDKVITESFGGKKTNVLRLTGVFQRADEKNANGRVYPEDVLRSAVENLQEAIDHRRVMGEFDHPCLTTEDFRVFTVDGWKEFRDIKVGDLIYSRVDGHMVPSKVKKVIAQPYSGLTYHMKGRHIDVAYTGPHRVLLQTRVDRDPNQEYATAEEIYNDRKKYNKHIIPRRAQWTGKTQEHYAIRGIAKCEELVGASSAKAHENYVRVDRTDSYVSENRYKNNITDDLMIDMKVFVGFLGLYLAEGNLGSSGYTILIHQKKDDYKPLIRELLSGFPEELKWKETDGYFHLSDRRLYEYLSELGNKYTKYIPNDIKELDSPCLEELVRWFQIGDGRLKHGCNNVFSVSHRLIQDLHECWVKAGGCCYSTTITTNDDYKFAGRIIEAKNKKPLYQLTLSNTNGIHLDDRFLSVEKKYHNGDIFCLTTEHGNFYMEHKGFAYWTGNCDAKIHMDRVSHLLTKLWMNEDGVVYGELEVLNDDRMPYGSMLACLVERGVQVGISSRGVGDMEMTMHEGEEAYAVQDGFNFVTFDAVAEPSVTGTQLMVMESLQKKKMAEGKQGVERSLLKELRNSLFGVINEVSDTCKKCGFEIPAGSPRCQGCGTPSLGGPHKRMPRSRPEIQFLTPGEEAEKAMGHRPRRRRRRMMEPRPPRLERPEGFEESLVKRLSSLL